MKAIRLKEGRFLAEFDLNGTLIYCNAGHPAALLVRADGTVIQAATMSSDSLVWLGIVFCISQSAMFSGLNLAFFSLDRLQQSRAALEYYELALDLAGTRYAGFAPDAVDFSGATAVIQKALTKATRDGIEDLEQIEDLVVSARGRRASERAAHQPTAAPAADLG